MPLNNPAGYAEPQRMSFLEMQKRKQARPGPPQLQSAVAPPQQQPNTNPPQYTPVPPPPPIQSPTDYTPVPSPNAAPPQAPKTAAPPAGGVGTIQHAGVSPGQVVPSDGQANFPYPFHQNAQGQYVAGWGPDGGGMISQAAWDAGYRQGDPWGQPSQPPGRDPNYVGADGRSTNLDNTYQEPGQHTMPANPAWQGWKPGMDPFDPASIPTGFTPYTGGTVDVVRKPTRAEDPIGDLPHEGGPQPSGGQQERYEPDEFDIGEIIRRLISGFGGQDRFNFSGPSTEGGTEDLINRLLGNPSAYDDEVIQREFGRLSGQIDDDYNMRDVAINEDSIRRGLGDSTIRGGRLQDSNVMRRSAKTEMGDRLLKEAAQTRSSDTLRAIQAGMGYGDQQFSRQMQSFMADMQARGASHNEIMGLVNLYMRYGDQIFGNQMDTARFNADQEWRDDVLDQWMAGLP